MNPDGSRQKTNDVLHIYLIKIVVLQYGGQ